MLIKTPVTKLVEGDYVDLEMEDAPYTTAEDRENIYAFEYALVLGIEQETPDCVLVDFNSTSIGFPTDHEVWVKR
jgi:hypothetical protein